eukprot:Nk52_evm154s226 gene=Nk52_evmTU154s226
MIKVHDTKMSSTIPSSVPSSLYLEQHKQYQAMIGNNSIANNDCYVDSSASAAGDSRLGAGAMTTVNNSSNAGYFLTLQQVRSSSRCRERADSNSSWGSGCSASRNHNISSNHSCDSSSNKKVSFGESNGNVYYVNVAEGDDTLGDGLVPEQREQQEELRRGERQSSSGSSSSTCSDDMMVGVEDSVLKNSSSLVRPKPILKNRSRDTSLNTNAMPCMEQEKGENELLKNGVPMDPESPLLPELWEEVLDCTENVVLSGSACCFPSDREFRNNIVKCKKELTQLRNTFNINKTLLKLNYLFQCGKLTAEDYSRKTSIVALIQMNQILQRRTALQKEKFGSFCM